MTTSQSPVQRLKEQADKIADVLKTAALGGIVANNRENVTFGIVMGDKIIKVTMKWETIRETDEAGISAWIVEYMCDKKATMQ